MYNDSFLDQNKLFLGWIIFFFSSKFSSQNNFDFFFSTFAILETQPWSYIENQVKTIQMHSSGGWGLVSEEV